ncbi:hypothetical protein [Rheinheimera pacifica]|uniref:hypothetical protein n=1 Tax=Rheinheimera pacifica TaxID=173990 RepID=UPI002EDB2991
MQKITFNLPFMIKVLVLALRKNSDIHYSFQIWNSQYQASVAGLTRTGNNSGAKKNKSTEDKANAIWQINTLVGTHYSTGI